MRLKLHLDHASTTVPSIPKLKFYLVLHYWPHSREITCLPNNAFMLNSTDKVVAWTHRVLDRPVNWSVWSVQHAMGPCHHFICTLNNGMQSKFVCLSVIKRHLHSVWILLSAVNHFFSTLSFTGRKYQWIHIPIKDERPPDINQVTQFVNVVNDARKRRRVRKYSHTCKIWKKTSLL